MLILIYLISSIPLFHNIILSLSIYIITIVFHIHYIYLNMVFMNISIQFIFYSRSNIEVHGGNYIWPRNGELIHFFCSTCLSTWLIMWNMLHPLNFVVIFCTCHIECLTWNIYVSWGALNMHLRIRSRQWW